MNEKIKPFTNRQFGKIGVLVNFIIQIMKSKHLVCLSFLWWQVFWGNERKHFTHIPGLPWLKINEKVVKKKKRTTVENLRKDCHIEFHMYLNYVRSLSFDEKPDYDYLRKLFNKLYYKIQNMTGNLTGLQKKVTSILWVMGNKVAITIYSWTLCQPQIREQMSGPEIF